MNPNLKRFRQVLIPLALPWLLGACGGSTTTPIVNSSPSKGVALATATGNTINFAAYFENIAPSLQKVTFSVDPGGAGGSINPDTGLYTAPFKVVQGKNVDTVTVTTDQVGAKPSKSTVTILVSVDVTASQTTVSVTPAVPDTIQPLHYISLTASVAGDLSVQEVQDQNAPPPDPNRGVNIDDPTRGVDWDVRPANFGSFRRTGAYTALYIPPPALPAVDAASGQKIITIYAKSRNQKPTNDLDLPANQQTATTLRKAISITIQQASGGIVIQ
jgi:hypothetical protein